MFRESEWFLKFSSSRNSRNSVKPASQAGLNNLRHRPLSSALYVKKFNICNSKFRQICTQRDEIPSFPLQQILLIGCGFFIQNLTGFVQRSWQFREISFSSVNIMNLGVSPQSLKQALEANHSIPSHVEVPHSQCGMKSSCRSKSSSFTIDVLPSHCDL